ncbi:porin family protein [Flavobacterium sp. SUN046]|uniref:porin family protein n=1 Tax=Flavobacterium sp. SUN046 TaxID=3002440 RepID=UPI002DBEB5A6|nr:porin family protein [Flavobacterium sp. SUN046]MEC4049912.1 porin family protein [Flavobacterium sp. SUN046]
MKKAIVMIAMVALTVTNSYSQSGLSTDNREKLFFGLKIGANYSNVYDSKGDDFVADAKFGIAAGGFVSIPIGRYFGIQPEVLFSQKGYKSTGTFLGSSYSMTRTSDYIDVPLLVSFKPIENVSLLFGPQFSYLLEQKDKFTGGTITSTQEQTYTNDNIRKNTFCLTGGADLNFGHLVFGVRGGWDVNNNNGDGTSTTPRYKNMWYQGTVGFRF